MSVIRDVRVADLAYDVEVLILKVRQQGNKRDHRGRLLNESFYIIKWSDTEEHKYPLKFSEFYQLSPDDCPGHQAKCNQHMEEFGHFKREWDKRREDLFAYLESLERREEHNLSAIYRHLGLLKAKMLAESRFKYLRTEWYYLFNYFCYLRVLAGLDPYDYEDNGAFEENAERYTVEQHRLLCIYTMELPDYIEGF